MRKRFTAAGVRCTGQGSLIRLFPEDMNATWWKAYESGILLGTNGLIALSTAMDDEILETIANRTMEIMNN
jgi:glutamate-1-semialdehyde 2,1-aminomutase